MGSLRGATIPILATRDLDGTVGFTVGSVSTSPAVRGVRSGLPPLAPGGCYLRLTDAQAVYDDWEPLRLPEIHLPRDTPWGMREFFLVDPSGNLIRIGTPLG